MKLLRKNCDVARILRYLDALGKLNLTVIREALSRATKRKPVSSNS